LTSLLFSGNRPIIQLWLSFKMQAAPRPNCQYVDRHRKPNPFCTFYTVSERIFFCCCRFSITWDCWITASSQNLQTRHV